MGRGLNFASIWTHIMVMMVHVQMRRPFSIEKEEKLVACKILRNINIGASSAVPFGFQKTLPTIFWTHWMLKQDLHLVLVCSIDQLPLVQIMHLFNVSWCHEYNPIIHKDMNSGIAWGQAGQIHGTIWQYLNQQSCSSIRSCVTLLFST